MEERAILPVLASTLWVENARDLGLILILTRSLSAACATGPTSLRRSRWRSTTRWVSFHMFERAILTSRASPTLKSKARLLLFTTSRGCRGLRLLVVGGCTISCTICTMSSGDGRAITAGAFPFEKLLNALDKIAISVLFFPFLSSIIDF